MLLWRREVSPDQSFHCIINLVYTICIYNIQDWGQWISFNTKLLQIDKMYKHTDTSSKQCARTYVLNEISTVETLCHIEII